MATRQNSSSGKPKSPRIQVVLPESLWKKLSELAHAESRTVSNMAKVLIQKSIDKIEKGSQKTEDIPSKLPETEGFRSVLEAQETKRLRGAPRRIRFYRN